MQLVGVVFERAEPVEKVVALVEPGLEPVGLAAPGPVELGPVGLVVLVLELALALVVLVVLAGPVELAGLAAPGNVALVQFGWRLGMLHAELELAPAPAPALELAVSLCVMLILRHRLCRLKVIETPQIRFLLLLRYHRSLLHRQRLVH